MKFEFTAPANRKENVDTVEMSESERVDNYAHTGDPSYLTVELARKMGVYSDVMKQVVGATAEDIELAEIVESESNDSFELRAESLLADYSCDDLSLEGLDIHEKFRKLLDISTIRLKIAEGEDRISQEIVKESALSKIEMFLITEEESTYRLFEVLQLDSPQGFRDIMVMESVINRVMNRYQDGYAAAKPVLDEIMDIASRMQGVPYTNEALYLGSAYLSRYLEHQSGLRNENKLESNDSYVPFEITQGIYAVFTEDLDRVYVADTDTSSIIKDTINSAWTSEFRGPEAHNLPNYAYKYIPEDLVYLAGDVLNSGIPLDDYLVSVGIDSGKYDIKDFITILRGSFRQVIEQDFGFRLTSLSLPEQFHFLNYLKNTTVGSVKTMQEFLKHYGADAMRSFLANAYDPKASENIMIFGTMIEPETAQNMFSAFAQTVDNTANLTENIIGSEDLDMSVQTLMRGVQEGMVKRAGHLFEAGKQMSLSEYQGEENTSELIQAYQGVAKMQEVLARISLM